MPALAPLVPVFEAIAAAATIGGTIYEVTRPQPQPQPATPPVQPTAPTQQDNAALQAEQKAAIARQYPNLQEQLGGAVAPDYYVQEASSEVGAAGQTNVGLDAFRQFLGDKNLQLDPSQGGLTTSASAAQPGGTIWESLQQQQPGLDQVSGGLT